QGWPCGAGALGLTMHDSAWTVRADTAQDAANERRANRAGTNVGLCCDMRFSIGIRISERKHESEFCNRGFGLLCARIGAAMRCKFDRELDGSAVRLNAHLCSHSRGPSRF